MQAGRNSSLISRVSYFTGPFAVTYLRMRAALFVLVAVVIGLVLCGPSPALRAKIQARLAELKAKRAELIPPSAPEVVQLSDTSVMLNWTVPENTGLPIIFFRVQYKRVAPKESSWVTEDIEIDSHIRTCEVNGLRPGPTYIFRIAAVYSNDDFRHGPNSDRFEIGWGQVAEPTIVEVTPIDIQNTYALNITWQQNVVTSSSIKGFYIYIKPYHAMEPFEKLELLSPSVRTVVLSNLLPGTEYLIKMQSFNSAGTSSFSNEVVQSTKGSNLEAFIHR